MKFAVSDSGDEAFRKLMKKIGLISDLDVKVGFVRGKKEARSDGMLTNALIGYVHEFGVPGKIPARPFLLPAMRQKRSQVQATMREGLRVALGIAGDPRAINRAMGQCGALIRDQAKANIREQVGFEALAPETLRARARNGFKGTKALIRTGQLMGAIQFELTDGNS